MSKNVNVFIGVLLCAVLCGTFVWLSSSGDESSWSPNDIYNEVQGAGSAGGYATTSATFSGPSNEGGVALPMSSSSMRARSSYKYAGAYSGAATTPLTSSPLSSSASLLPSLQGGVGGRQALYTTSSAEIKSFGGGGNGGAAMGGAMSHGRSNSGLSNPSLQGGAGVSISPIAYSTARRSGMSSVAGDDLAMMAAENPVMAMTNAASVGMGNGFYGAYSVMDYSSTNYAEYTGMFGGSRMGVRGRQNAGPWDSWLSWLYDNETGAWGTGTQDENGNWIYTYSEEQLRAAYEEWKKTYGQAWGPNPPSFDAWWEWMLAGGYDGYMYGDNTYRWVPVGSIIPLLLLALLYVLLITIKSKPLKSLLKTERSE